MLYNVSQHFFWLALQLVPIYDVLCRSLYRHCYHLAASRLPTHPSSMIHTCYYMNYLLFTVVRGILMALHNTEKKRNVLEDGPTCEYLWPRSEFGRWAALSRNLGVLCVLCTKTFQSFWIKFWTFPFFTAVTDKNV